MLCCRSTELQVLERGPQLTLFRQCRWPIPCCFLPRECLYFRTMPPEVPTHIRRLPPSPEAIVIIQSLVIPSSFQEPTSLYSSPELKSLACICSSGVFLIESWVSFDPKKEKLDSAGLGSALAEFHMGKQMDDVLPASFHSLAALTPPSWSHAHLCTFFSPREDSAVFCSGLKSKISWNSKVRFICKQRELRRASRSRTC